MQKMGTDLNLSLTENDFIGIHKFKPILHIFSSITVHCESHLLNTHLSEACRKMYKSFRLKSLVNNAHLMLPEDKLFHCPALEPLLMGVVLPMENNWVQVKMKSPWQHHKPHHFHRASDKGFLFLSQPEQILNALLLCVRKQLLSPDERKKKYLLELFESTNQFNQLFVQDENAKKSCYR